MRPLQIRINRIVDFGTIVSLLGIDTETDKPVTIHVDHRPFSSFWQAWREAGFPQPVEFEADRLMLRLDIAPADEAGEVGLAELDSSKPTASNCNRQRVQEMDQ
jgi:hypothetical protein